MRLFFLLILLCSFFFCSSQTKKKVDDSSNYFDQIQKDIVKFKPQLCKDCKEFPFSDIKIIDKRYDTSAFGYMNFYKNVRRNCKLVTSNGLSYDLENYLNSVYKNTFTSTGPSLVIVLRKFWFYSDYIFHQKDVIQPNNSIDDFLNLGIDCFLFSDNSYTPLIRKDTAIAVDEKIRESAKGTTIVESLRDVVNSLQLNHLPGNILNRKKFNNEKLNEYYDKNFRLPVLIDKQLKKGVYMSFDEFKNNAPSDTDFDIRKTKLADDIYLIDGKDTIPTRTAWGYCDGKNVFIKIDMNLFQLNKQDRSFAFMGNKKLTHSQNNPRGYSYNDYETPTENLMAAGLESLIFPHDRFKLTLVPMHLDMERGEVF